MLQQAKAEVEGLDGGALFVEEGAIEVLDDWWGGLLPLCFFFWG
jgi:hypothetical protein